MKFLKITIDLHQVWFSPWIPVSSFPCAPSHEGNGQHPFRQHLGEKKTHLRNQNPVLLTLVESPHFNGKYYKYIIYIYIYIEIIGISIWIYINWTYSYQIFFRLKFIFWVPWMHKTPRVWKSTYQGPKRRVATILGRGTVPNINLTKNDRLDMKKMPENGHRMKNEVLMNRILLLNNYIISFRNNGAAWRWHLFPNCLPTVSSRCIEILKMLKVWRRLFLKRLSQKIHRPKKHGFHVGESKESKIKLVSSWISISAPRSSHQSIRSSDVDIAINLQRGSHRVFFRGDVRREIYRRKKTGWKVGWDFSINKRAGFFPRNRWGYDNKVIWYMEDLAHKMLEQVSFEKSQMTQMCSKGLAGQDLFGHDNRRTGQWTILGRKVIKMDHRWASLILYG